MVKIQIQSLNKEELVMELDSAIAIINQLQIDLENSSVLTKSGWNVFNAMRQELERIWRSVISDKG